MRKVEKLDCDRIILVGQMLKQACDNASCFRAFVFRVFVILGLGVFFGTPGTFGTGRAPIREEMANLAKLSRLFRR
jgi:hypothetical protein